MVYLIAALAAAALFLALAPGGTSAGALPVWREGIPPAWRPAEAGDDRRLFLLVPPALFLLVGIITGAWMTALISLPAGILLASTLRDALAHLRAQVLRDHLQEALLSLATSLKAGQSLPNALQRCAADLRRLHPGGGQLIHELEVAAREVELGMPVDEALLGLRDRVPLEEVSALVEALVTTRRRGGNIVDVMGNVAHMVADRLAVEREIQVMTAQKRTEAAILALIPLGIYLVVRLTNPTYLGVFHATRWGQVALGLIFLTVAGGYWMAQRIARIDM
ncbi:tight adherence protein B [Symbiobacterium terraclitae]|jgi:tight adherence protein B|uniref:Tight adherence protein B n=1 Tax=Symbiobacterium terraclitae TaxID=557451 RepID=A0ABS4JUG5_9FIRM|nr:type II secretion system F family protein [Symbiobacterium terraclitae]MBP2019178.1 tight adherence protein B [Symbiobacterium terraclitae]